MSNDKNMSERKYKVGDVVRTLVDIDAEGNKLFPKGTIGTVTHIDEYNKYPYKVEALNDFWYYSGDMLEPAQDQRIGRQGMINIRKDDVLDKIRAEILDCLMALDEIEKSGLNIYLPNEISGRRLTYQQCLGFIDKYKAEFEPQEKE